MNKEKILRKSDDFSKIISYQKKYQNNKEIKINPHILFTRLSYTHIIQLLHLKDNLQRTFYAAESIRGTWSVRELKRQINTNYYVRSGWSKNPELLSDNIKKRNELQPTEFNIKNPYYFFIPSTKSLYKSLSNLIPFFTSQFVPSRPCSAIPKGPRKFQRA